ncbi:hyaluronan synthase [Cellulomonas chitinilytica]|uniref:Hyaluronan synthase n=1 Tax=Cellulomonas chitinilytica TaxID=398759 RepID=A0A919NZS2_9CELL|nr:glycosyltransferase family 2 protein [Cellulomonas chitinilytica]GIG20577.1 hyaluronan synthase [Cellulomonas chitinilytica]
MTVGTGPDRDDELSARVSTSGATWLLTATAVAMALYASFHLWVILVADRNPWVDSVYLVAVLCVLVQLVLAARDQQPRPDRADGASTAGLKVAALVPAYNEDPDALRRCLSSLLAQTRPLSAVCVVDDGSTSGDYAEVKAWFLARCEETGVDGSWTRQKNGGKRQAQMTGARLAPDADIYLTIDSDTIVDARATEEALPRFADESVQSVAGHILVLNYRTNLLTRLQEVWFGAWQMVDRGGLSAMGCVLVNSGGCAYYRAAVLLDNAEQYLGETLFGRSVQQSDDSLLTMFALQRGRAVQQASVFAFTLMPERLGHHARQQLRWMRGSYLRAVCRFQELPVRGLAYWIHLLKWARTVAGVAVLVGIAVAGHGVKPGGLVWSGAVAAALVLLISTPYLSLRRSDQTAWQRALTFACAPLVGLWQATVIGGLRLYALATVTKVGWGTRKSVEVTA